MLKGDIIGPYKVLKDFVVAGGMSKVSFVEKAGKEYFIKEFLSPKYPIEGSPGSEVTLKRRRDKCSVFENHHLKLNNAIATKVSLGGNLVYAIDFFRSGTSYYKVTEKIDISSLAIEDVNRLGIEKIKIILKTAAHSLKILHDLGIVHGDLKPDNILIKETLTGSFTTKLIDFDNSYFSSKPPKDSNDVVGTPDYYSPELGTYIKDAETDSRPDLTTKSDIFALGIIFTQYLTGAKPKITSKHSYLWESLLAGNALNLEGKHLSSRLNSFLKSMLQIDPEKRPDITQVFTKLGEKSLFEIDESEYLPSGAVTGGLRGKGLDGSIAGKLADEPAREKSGLKGKGLKIARKE